MKVPRFLDQRLRMRQLRFLEALNQHRSLSKAAKALRLSQPALTKALHELEDAVGATLFDRNAQGVVPTAAGRIILGSASRILAEVRRLDDELDQLTTPGAGLVVLGALPVAAAGLLPDVVRDLRLHYPALELRMVSGRSDELLLKLAVGELDMVLGRLYPQEVPDGLVREVMYEEPISAIARADHPVFQRHPRRPADIAGYDLVLPTFGQRLGQEIEHLLTTHELAESSRSLRSTSHQFIGEVLHLTDMITIAPSLLMAGDLRRGSLKIVPVSIPMRRPAGLVLNPGRPLSPSAILLIDAIRKTIGQLTDGIIL